MNLNAEQTIKNPFVYVQIKTVTHLIGAIRDIHAPVRDSNGVLHAPGCCVATGERAVLVVNNRHLHTVLLSTSTMLTLSWACPACRGVNRELCQFVRCYSVPFQTRAWCSYLPDINEYLNKK